MIDQELVGECEDKLMFDNRVRSEVTEELVYYEHNIINDWHTDVRVVLSRLKSDLKDINNE